MKNFLKRCVSGITGKDFLPPVIFKIHEKFKNYFRILPKTKRNAHFIYLPEDYSPDCVVDIGAATGYTAKAALDSFPEIPVFCIEPVLSSFEILKKSVAMYGNRAKLLNVALSDCEEIGEIHLFNSPYADSLNSMSDSYRKANPDIHETGIQKVQITTLDLIREKIPCSGNIFVKMDVEGEKLAVLRGGSAFFQEQVSGVITELSFNRSAEKANAVVNLLQSFGFELVNVFDVIHGEDHQIVQCDAVFMKKKS